jgi:hypothetical protein
MSITRARAVEIIPEADPAMVFASTQSGIQITIDG